MCVYVCACVYVCVKYVCMCVLAFMFVWNLVWFISSERQVNPSILVLCKVFANEYELPKRKVPSLFLSFCTLHRWFAHKYTKYKFNSNVFWSTPSNIRSIFYPPSWVQPNSTCTVSYSSTFHLQTSHLPIPNTFSNNHEIYRRLKIPFPVAIGP